MAMVVLLTAGIHLGRALANVWAGAGWHLPAWDDVFVSIPGVLRGDAAAGLSGLAGPPAGATILLGWIIAVEAVLFTGLLVGMRFCLRRWRPGRIKGMAGRSEAEQLLGLSRLRRNATVIRPDLYAEHDNPDNPYLEGQR